MVKADGAGFGTLGAQAMADGLPGVFRDQFLQIYLGTLMFLVGRSRPAESRKVATMSAQLLEALMSTTRTASSRGRGGSTPKR